MIDDRLLGYADPYGRSADRQGAARGVCSSRAQIDFWPIFCYICSTDAVLEGNQSRDEEVGAVCTLSSRPEGNNTASHRGT